MKKNKFYVLLSLLVLVGMVLASCAPAATSTTEEAAMTEDAAITEDAPAAIEEPEMSHTDRKGGWLDEMDFSVVSAESAITQLEAGTIDLYSFALASDQVDAINAAGLNSTNSFGGNYAMMFNPAVFDDSSVLNPFSNRKIREAMNWAIDRNYINQEIYGGGSLPKLFAISTELVEYTNLIETARALETKYAYDFDKAKAVVDAEMPGMGAELVDGKWTFNGEPVSLIFLIRNDGDGTRQPMGDYFANQLEAMGFTVDRQYKRSSEAAPIWIGTAASDGQWNIYTAGWLPSGLTRDEKAQIQQMYLESSSQGIDPFISNVSDPKFKQLGDDLANGNFATKEERDVMMAEALALSLEDSLQVWVIDQLQYSPFSQNVQVTYDLAAGLESAVMGPYNTRFVDQEGGTMKVGTNDLFTDPWNTISGSNWVWDSNIHRATSQGSSNIVGGGGLMGDPYTGLAWPQRIESAELVYKSGLPIVKSLDWLKVTEVNQIDVPADAWIDWNAETQTFVPASEKYPEGTTANTLSIVTYPADLFETVKWHDGSPISVGDFVMAYIMQFDRSYPESAIYDESSVPGFESLLPTYKGMRITSTDPLTIEYYSDLYNADAELNIIPLWPSSPAGLSGDNSWPIFAISNLAEANEELAYSSDKADTLGVEWMSWVGGPSLEILDKYLEQAASESYIPYEPTMGQYVTKEEADARYANFKQWYADHGHFYVGTGPYYIDQVFTTEKALVLKNNTEFPDFANRWSAWSEPQLATAVLDGPGQVAIGGEAVFDVIVNFKDDAYPNEDIKQVKFILYDATGSVVHVGNAEATGEGQYQVTLDSEITSKLQSGSAKLEVAVVPIPVAIPAFTSADFVVQ